MANTPTVTKDSLQAMLDNPNPKYVERVVGRALWAIHQNQTADERELNETREHNGIGFNSADAYSGSLTAKAFKRNGYLSGWQLDKWLKKDVHGYSRLAKYHRQLNEIAKRRQ